MQTEIWKDIEGFESYQVSSLGNVRSLDMMLQHWQGGTIKREGRILKQCFDPDGYNTQSMYKNGKRHTPRTHRLVAIAFIPNPENKPQVNHKNGIKHDNRLENLEWATAKENTVHAHKILKIPKRFGEDVGTSKLTKLEVIEIKALLRKEEISQRQIAKIFNISPMTITNIKLERVWANI